MKRNLLKTVILDDEPQAARLLKDIAAAIPGIAVAATFTDPIEALEAFGDLSPDLLFLDIQMPRMNGFEFIQKLREMGSTAHVIFVTAYDQYAIEAIRNEAFDYVLKPVAPDELAAAVQRLVLHIETETHHHREVAAVSTGTGKLRFTDRHGITFLAPQEIIYIQADGNYCLIHTPQKKLMISMQIGEVEELVEPLGFMRINRSFIINPAYLTRLDRKRHVCHLECGSERFEVSVSETRIRSGGFGL